MGMQDIRRWSILLTWAILAQHAAARGTIDLKFYKYAGDGKDEGGNCCDSIFPWGCDNNPCDPFFYVCIDHLDGSTSDGDCHYMGQLRTGVIHERNHITFGNNIGGTANPMTKSLTTIPKNVRLKITVVDSDPANSHDVISRLIKTERDIIPTFNGNQGSYRDTTLKTNSRAELQVKIRTYCDRYYYGDTCTKYCKDNEGGHYTCSNTGDKVCNIGWKGDNCNVDIDECIIPSFCKNGATCNNLQGGYRCECADGFKGNFCQEVNHTCAVNPCLNGGSCTGNQTDYTCDCLPWWGGKTCADAVDTCASSPCLNNGTCIANNVTTPGYTCNCESTWTGSACNTSVKSSTTTTTTPSTTTSPIQSTTPTTTVIYYLGDPYYITLLGEIDDTNINPLRTGLVKLIKDLGDIPGDVFVKVKPQIIPIRTGVTTTYVEFFSTGEKGPIDPKKIDDIFNTNSDETINAYLPLPLYRPIEGPESLVSAGSWATDNWYAIVIPILAAVVIVTCIIAFLFASKRRKEKENSFMRSDSNVEPAHPSNMAFENVLYHETHRGLQSEVHDGGEVTFNPPEREVARGACADDVNPYQQPVQYDTPVKQPTCTPNGVQHYQNSNLAALDTRCEAGANDYTMFSDLDGAKCDGENPYQELDDVQAEKAAIAVGFRQEQDVSLPIDSDDDSEDEIDKIKRQIKEDISDA